MAYRGELPGYRYADNRLYRNNLHSGSSNYHMDDNGRNITFCDCAKIYAIKYRCTGSHFHGFVAKRKYKLSTRKSPGMIKQQLKPEIRKLRKDSWNDC